MLELLFLLLPVAAGYGWIMGRNSTKHKETQSKVSLSKQYSAGLNFLLSDQEEKAVEHLIEFLEVNNDTLETHLALANLFRKRGEFDKAIEIHERLNGLELDDACLQKVTLELAKDYISAGMLDRAEKCLLRITLNQQNKDIILQMLVNIYQTMKDYNKSDELCSKHKNLSKRLTCTLSHHCCELAEETIGNDNVVKWYKKALRYDSGCVRAHLALAQMAEDDGKFDRAIEQLQHVLTIDMSFAPLVLDKIEQSFLAIGDKKGCYVYLTELASDSHTTKNLGAKNLGVSFAVKYSQYIQEFEGAKQALDYILTSLERDANIRAFAQLLELESQITDSQKAAEQFMRIKQLVNRYLASKPLYECRNCGFSSKLHYWLCPSCQTWGSSKPSIA